MCQAPVAVSASHAMLAFIRPSDTASRWNGCRKERERKKQPAHQLKPKGPLTEFPSHAITAVCAQTAPLSTCGECYTSPLEHTVCLFHRAL